jgi:hypothetical protein
MNIVKHFKFYRLLLHFFLRVTFKDAVNCLYYIVSVCVCVLDELMNTGHMWGNSDKEKKEVSGE